MMKETERLSGRAYVAIGLMLFAMFFGAGNLIFPASLGQQSGQNMVWAIGGFILSDVGLSLLGIIAIGYSGCRTVREVANRMHPVFGFIYSLLIFLVLGPAFVVPRTGTVAYEIAINPLLGTPNHTMLIGFCAIFFALTAWLAISPNKLVTRIGKILTPALLIVILMLTIKSFITPLGGYGNPTPDYATPMLASMKGFLDGYNTMDALGAIVLGALSMDFLYMAGARTKGEVAVATMKSGLVAGFFLALVYFLIAMLGATSVDTLGMFSNGVPVLVGSAQVLFGSSGAILLAVIVVLACFTTSVGLLTLSVRFFHENIGGLSYSGYVILLSIISFFVALFGLDVIIVAAIPVLMLLYPLTIGLIVLLLLDKYTEGRQCVYVGTIGCLLIVAITNACEAAGVQLGGITNYMATHVPFYSLGMGWITFLIVGLILGFGYKVLKK